MTIRTESDAVNGIRRHRVTGALTFQAFRAELESVYARPEMQALSPLWDLRDARIDMTAVEMRQIADLIGARWLPSDSVRASLVVSKDYDFAMSRMLELLLDGRSSNDVMVFRNIEAAEAWLKKGRADA